MIWIFDREPVQTLICGQVVDRGKEMSNILKHLALNKLIGKKTKYEVVNSVCEKQAKNV